jgi:replication fork protection complex subunit Csm3/Swi3
MVEKAGHKKRVAIARSDYINESKPKDANADEEEDDLFGDNITTRHANRESIRLTIGTTRAKTPEQDADVPDDDDLYDATPRPSRPIVPIRNDVPEEDDLEALIAEAEGRDVAQKANTQPTQAKPDEDDLDALMAEAEIQDLTTKKGEAPKENSKSKDNFDDEEAAMQEMDGLW